MKNAVLEQVRREDAPRRLEPYVGLHDALAGGRHEDDEP